MDYKKVLAIILGGGKGTRLYPLTKERSKPAVPFGGKYRLVDIPISNCINSGIRNIYVLTQFNSASLHMHVHSTYKFDSFSGGFVEILAAEQTPHHEGWYSGTADAVRKNFMHFKPLDPEYYLILSGDQLYRMNFQHFLGHHEHRHFDLTVAATAVDRETASELGIMRIDEQGRILEFLEKPGYDADVSNMEMPASFMKKNHIPAQKKYLASMGIYVFGKESLDQSLANNKTDFGKEVIPDMIHTHNVGAFVYHGYWEDIGTIKSFYDANLDLASVKPSFNMYDSGYPLYAQKTDLPPSKMNSCNLIHSLATEGSIITESFIKDSLVGMRTIIESGANLDGVICLGADFYESDEQRKQNRVKDIPNIGIGCGTLIKRAIIDKNARIGAHCRIGIDKAERIDGDYGYYTICDGIIIIRKNATLPDGTII
jgi:glucose-1-phosphate adenylyltransferase